MFRIEHVFLLINIIYTDLYKMDTDFITHEVVHSTLGGGVM